MHAEECEGASAEALLACHQVAEGSDSAVHRVPRGGRGWAQRRGQGAPWASLGDWPVGGFSKVCLACPRSGGDVPTAGPQKRGRARTRVSGAAAAAIGPLQGGQKVCRGGLENLHQARELHLAGCRPPHLRQGPAPGEEGEGGPKASQPPHGHLQGGERRRGHCGDVGCHGRGGHGGGRPGGGRQNAPGGHKALEGHKDERATAEEIRGDSDG
mmetsp:Transcript_12286/g.29300  ORF Transcript_12286/g.29300 Transcript_12286/m.29300 type:complete len:213 (-) Transcript_12286:117-755(-)